MVTSGSDTCFVRFGDDYADVRDGTDGLDFLVCHFRARKSGRLWEQRRVVRAEHRCRRNTPNPSLHIRS
ncbi:MAG: hypothetical protein ACRDT5_07030, partial [Mycobacterium sp.]